MKNSQQQDFEKPLQRIFDKYGVEDTTFKALMEHAYEAGKKEAWGETTQVPALFQEVISSEEEQELNFPELSEIWFDDIQVQGQEPAYELTQAQANFIRPLLADLSSLYQDEIFQVKIKAESLWHCCNPDTEIGKLSFKEMNKIRNYGRKLKAQQKTVDGIIYTLKYGKQK